MITFAVRNPGGFFDFAEGIKSGGKFYLDDGLFTWNPGSKSPSLPR